MYCRAGNYGYPSAWSFGGASVVENHQVGCTCLDAANRTVFFFSFVPFFFFFFLSLILNIVSVGIFMTALCTRVPKVRRVLPKLCVTLRCCYPVCAGQWWAVTPPVSLTAGLLRFWHEGLLFHQVMLSRFLLSSCAVVTWCTLVDGFCQIQWSEQLGGS